MERWSDQQVKLLPRARSLGLDALELSLGLDVKYSASLTRRAAQDAGMTLITSPGNEWAANADLSADEPEHRRAALDFHRRMIDESAAVGSIAYVGALYGRPGKVLRRRPPAAEYPRTAEGLHALAEHARQANLKLVIEPMSRFRSHVVNNPTQALRMVTLANHANLAILLDTYHLVTEVRDYAAAIRSVSDRIWGLHACENDRGVPGGGLLPWPQIFSAFAATKGEYVGFEAYNTGLDDDFGFRRGMFQNVCPDGDAFVRAAVAFAKKNLAK
jgi:D-psicose/D-tagatose/L-ribulose 3-epimerase